MNVLCAVSWLSSVVIVGVAYHRMCTQFGRWTRHRIRAAYSLIYIAAVARLFEPLFGIDRADWLDAILFVGVAIWVVSDRRRAR